MKTGKRNAMEKFLLSARTVDLRKRRNRKSGTDPLRLWTEPPLVYHSRGEGDAGGGDNKNPVGSDQRGRVTRHHSQAEQELPRRGAARAPDAERLIGRQHLTVNVLDSRVITRQPEGSCLPQGAQTPPQPGSSCMTSPQATQPAALHHRHLRDASAAGELRPRSLTNGETHLVDAHQHPVDQSDHHHLLEVLH